MVLSRKTSLASAIFAAGAVATTTLITIANIVDGRIGGNHGLGKSSSRNGNSRVIESTAATTNHRILLDDSNNVGRKLQTGPQIGPFPASVSSQITRSNCPSEADVYSGDSCEGRIQDPYLYQFCEYRTKECSCRKDAPQYLCFFYDGSGALQPETPRPQPQPTRAPQPQPTNPPPVPPPVSPPTGGGGDGDEPTPFPTTFSPTTFSPTVTDPPTEMGPTFSPTTTSPPTASPTEYGSTYEPTTTFPPTGFSDVPVVPPPVPSPTPSPVEVPQPVPVDPQPIPSPPEEDGTFGPTTTFPPTRTDPPTELGPTFSPTTTSPPTVSPTEMGSTYEPTTTSPPTSFLPTTSAPTFNPTEVGVAGAAVEMEDMPPP